MSIVRKLVLLAATVTAVLAFTASSASALSITQEPSAPCPAAGCEIHVNSVGQVELGSPLGMMGCDNEFQANVNTAGVGHIYQKTLTNCTPIAIAPCAPEWPINVQETSLELDMCLELFGALINCHLIFDIAESGHSYTLSTGGAHRACENDPGLSFQGTWVTEGTDVEIID